MRRVNGLQQVRKLSVRRILCSRGTVASPRSRRRVGLKNAEIRSGYCRYAAESRVTRSRRSANRGAGYAGLAHWVVLPATEEEELVLQNRAAEVSAEAVVIIALILREAVVLRGLVHRVEVAVLRVDVREAVESVRAALQHEIELAAGRVPEFRRVLILQNCEFGDGIVGDRNQRSSNGLTVIVDAFHREIVVPWTLPANAGARTCANPAAARHTGTQKRKIKDPAGTKRRAGKVGVHLGVERSRQRRSCRIQRLSDSRHFNGRNRALDLQSDRQGLRHV